LILTRTILRQKPVKERIARLRDEIAQISEANRLYSHGRNSYPAPHQIKNVGFNGCRKS
jgi:hypothetical protein